MSELLRVYLDPAEIGLDGYPYAWHKGEPAIKDLIRERDGHRCLRCGHPYLVRSGLGEWSPCDVHCMHRQPFQRVEEPHFEFAPDLTPRDIFLEEPRARILAQWRILTVHHLDGIKHDCRWWNLVSLCQRCHLTVQGKVYMERPWTKPHSEWFRPFVAGFYSWKYLDLELTQKETMARLDELLDLELTQEALF